MGGEHEGGRKGWGREGVREAQRWEAAGDGEGGMEEGMDAGGDPESGVRVRGANGRRTGLAVLLPRRAELHELSLRLTPLQLRPRVYSTNPASPPIQGNPTAPLLGRTMLLRKAQPEKHTSAEHACAPCPCHKAIVERLNRITLYISTVLARGTALRDRAG